MTLVIHDNNSNIFANHRIWPVIESCFEPMPWLLSPDCFAKRPARKRWKLFVVKILLYVAPFNESIILLKIAYFDMYLQIGLLFLYVRWVCLFLPHRLALHVLQILTHPPLVHQKNEYRWGGNFSLPVIKFNSFINSTS